jgi:hypothetical protein
MLKNDTFQRDVAPDRLLAEAMGIGRELAGILRDDVGLIDRRDRVLVETCADAAAQRRIMEPRYRGSIRGLIDVLDRHVAAATVERVEYDIVRVDDHGEHLGARRVRDVSDAARSLLRARQLAARMADLVDHVRDRLVAEQAVLDAIRDGGAR